MVNSVSSSDLKARLQKASQDVGGPKVTAEGTAKVAAPTSATDGVELSKAAQALPGGIDVGPPFDLELVSKIKKEIAEGRYPIDLESITDSLFESYRDLMS